MQFVVFNFSQIANVLTRYRNHSTPPDFSADTANNLLDYYSVGTMQGNSDDINLYA